MAVLMVLDVLIVQATAASNVTDIRAPMTFPTEHK
jgi:hypothetical protein